MPRAKKPVSVPAQIDRMVKRIVRKFQPQRDNTSHDNTSQACNVERMRKPCYD